MQSHPPPPWSKQTSPLADREHQLEHRPIEERVGHKKEVIMSDEQNVTEAPTERVSALTGRKYDPVVRKEKPQIVVTLELAPQPAPVELSDPMVFVEDGPAARRVEPREPAVALSDTKVAQLQRATKPDRTNDEQRLAEVKASLQDMITLARTIRADLKAFDAEHG